MYHYFNMFVYKLHCVKWYDSNQNSINHEKWKLHSVRFDTAYCITSKQHWVLFKNFIFLTCRRVHHGSWEIQGAEVSLGAGKLSRILGLACSVNFGGPTEWRPRISPSNGKQIFIYSNPGFYLKMNCCFSCANGILTLVVWFGDSVKRVSASLWIYQPPSECLYSISHER